MDTDKENLMHIRDELSQTIAFLIRGDNKDGFFMLGRVHYCLSEFINNMKEDDVDIK